MAIDIKHIDFLNTDDRELLGDLTETFKKFKLHNFETQRAISRFFERNRDETWSYNGKSLTEFYSPNKQARIQNCNNWAEFAKFVDNSEIKQIKSNACGNHLLCPFCASRKASKIQKRVEDFFYLFSDDIKSKNLKVRQTKEDVINNEFDLIISEHTKKSYEKVLKNQGNILDKNWYYIVLTVVNDSDIDKCFNHLRDSFSNVRQLIKDFKKGNNGTTVFKVSGGLYSIEITYNQYNNTFHPHINLMLAFDKPIKDVKMYPSKKLKNQTKIMYNSKILSEEWKFITGDSYITSVTPLPIDRNNHNLLKKNLMEILKYSLKFNSMDSDVMVDLYPHLFKKRLFGTLGFMYGLGLDSIKIEEFITDRKFYIFVMNYVNGIYRFQPKKTEIIMNEYDENGVLYNNDTILFNKVENLLKIKNPFENVYALKNLANDFVHSEPEFFSDLEIDILQKKGFPIFKFKFKKSLD
ncbi:MAG: hypothetical protein QM495_12815 [Lutibacter sp.]|uniref:hypothetical protein n=1 Tax=Lutibacter sp. TaxID=1925666 RepID=UPI00385B3EC0